LQRVGTRLLGDCHLRDRPPGKQQADSGEAFYVMLKHETPLKPASPKRWVIMGPIVRMGKERTFAGRVPDSLRHNLWLKSP
jgi:hypothetical protein